MSMQKGRMLNMTKMRHNGCYRDGQSVHVIVPDEEINGNR